jgi:C4-type Zn-finger protein
MEIKLHREKLPIRWVFGRFWRCFTPTFAPLDMFYFYSLHAVPYEQDNILNQLHCKCSTHAERKMFDVKEKEPARIVSEIRDEAKLWIQVDVKDLALLVRPIVSE